MKERLLTMNTYLIEITNYRMTFWEYETVKANSIEEAKEELRKTYGKKILFGYIEKIQPNKKRG
jgi:hypothetical protein